MSQRESGYERKERDLYETPEWVTLALKPHLNGITTVWEPAAGGGKMVTALTKMGFEVEASDIADGVDFLKCDKTGYDAVITNPPYALAQEFIEHALDLSHGTEMRRRANLVAMLLRTDYDHAKTRAHLFANCKTFAKKIVLTKRIVWFEAAEGKNAAPSFNHAWYIWDWQHEGDPVLKYHLAA